MKDNAKRTEKITVNLTPNEFAFIQMLSEKAERKPSELARLLLMRQACQEWGKLQPEGQPLHRPTLAD